MLQFKILKFFLCNIVHYFTLVQFTLVIWAYKLKKKNKLFFKGIPLLSCKFIKSMLIKLYHNDTQLIHLNCLILQRLATFCRQKNKTKTQRRKTTQDKLLPHQIVRQHRKLLASILNPTFKWINKIAMIMKWNWVRRTRGKSISSQRIYVISQKGAHSSFKIYIQDEWNAISVTAKLMYAFDESFTLRIRFQ